MNSKTFKVSIVAGILLSSSLYFSSEASASATKRNTTATITFETLAPPVIVDPLNPDTPKVPGTDEGQVNTTGGELTLDFAPNLYFGRHEVGKNGAYEFPALVNADKVTKPTEKTSDPFIQVTDRQLVPGNWEVTVQASAFSNSATGNPSLAGAFLTFNRGILTHPLTNINAISPLLASSIEVISGGASVRVLSADVGKGELTWVAHWIPQGQPTPPSIKLTVPADKIKKGTHTAALTWTLSAPGNP